MTATKHPAPFSARPQYHCDVCGRYLPMGGYGREQDYQDHLAAHAFWRNVRGEALEWALLPLVLLVCAWAALTGERRHEWTGRLAVALCVAVFLVTLCLGPGGH